MKPHLEKSYRRDVVKRKSFFGISWLLFSYYYVPQRIMEKLVPIFTIVVVGLWIMHVTQVLTKRYGTYRGRFHIKQRWY